MFTFGERAFTFGERAFTFGERTFTFGERTFTFGDNRGFRGFWNSFFGCWGVLGLRGSGGPVGVFWADPGVLWKKAPRAMRAMRGKTLETVPFQPYFGCTKSFLKVLSN